MLAVAAMAGETAWLDGLLRWRDGRLVWEHSRGLKVPTPADLSLAQRRLNQVGSYPRAAERTLGDVESWLEQRQARLELAKWLRVLPIAELPELAERARRDDARAIGSLVALLAAEAHCLDPLPLSPSRILLTRGPATEAALESFITDEAAPMAGRALAALTLGAIRARFTNAEPSDREPPWLSRADWPRRAYRWGCQFGLPPEPGLIVILVVAGENGTALARRCLSALAAPSPFRLAPPLLRELLARGVPPDQAVAAAEATVTVGSLGDRLGADDIAAVNEVLGRFVRQTRDPVVVEQIARLCTYLLDLEGPSERLIQPMAAALRQAVDLPAHLLLDWLEILVEQRARIWNPADAGEPDSEAAIEWLSTMLAPPAQQVRDLLEWTRDRRLVRQALELNCAEVFSRRSGEPPEFYRAVLGLAREVDAANSASAVSSLCSLVRAFPGVSAARAAVQPLAQGLRSGPAEVRAQLLYSVVCELGWERHVIPEGLTRVTRHLSRLMCFATESAEIWCESCLPCPLVAATFLLDRAAPEQSGDWLSWALSHLAQEVGARGCHIIWRFQGGVALAASLATDSGQFQAILRACLDHDLREATLVERALPALARYRPLGAALAALFPEQPRRCLDLLTRLGLAARLGSQTLDALQEFESDPSADRPPFPPEWQSVIAQAPELEAPAATYLQARRVLGADAALPRGIERVLAQPLKLASELAFLERLVDQRPERIDLASRAQNLRSRLAEAERIQRDVRQEAAERLAHLAAREQLAAVERLVETCYRARLQRATGLPVYRPLDEDLMNAALLTADIEKNRRLLIRLLRTHLAGDHRWREQLPANATFLRQLAERGGDARAWLAAHPSTYACPEVAGGKVRLRLESEPIRILQMGNYFDTCLSFGGINAFSTVANAADLNKRVIYATDVRGRVVGRKLIALDDNGGLVGFRTYSSLSGGSGNAALREIFRHYCGRFAERCGVPLADQGTVPPLVARDWYDDGVVPWGPETIVRELSPSGSRGHGARPHPRPAALPGPGNLDHAARRRSHPNRRPPFDRSGRIRRLRAQGRGYRSDQR